MRLLKSEWAGAPVGPPLGDWGVFLPPVSSLICSHFPVGFRDPTGFGEISRRNRLLRGMAALAMAARAGRWAPKTGAELAG